MTNLALSPAAPVAAGPALTPRREGWLSLRANRGAMAALCLILAIILAALLADVISPYDPYVPDTNHTMMPPAWAEQGMAAHPLGTDDLGRDLLTRLIYGTRLSLLIGLIVVTLSLTVG